MKIIFSINTHRIQWRRAVAQLAEHQTRDHRVDGSSLNSNRLIVLCPCARHIISCLMLVQPRKTCPDMTEKLLTWT